MGYKWHVSYPIIVYNIPHCGMSSIFLYQIVLRMSPRDRRVRLKRASLPKD